ncbi:hypothetical protein EHP00_1292 [Ecytonucleospora hepatopenaei]|uniref:Uncharacterized protein n=1 Tax=Ecytonucleospora hepatopenaei TaxID=646526 RepID=A0A1W0E709_9MICR|nr:hypothetical protein EHP00_1292 [Ecytonucleospora hepatopenaei]
MTQDNNEELLQTYIKQKEELEKLISELKSQMNTTNIPFSRYFLEKHEIYNASKILKSENVVELKIFVNKKCNQISTDIQHTYNIVSEFKKYENDEVFFDLFLLKILDQGKIQVASKIDFFKPLSFITSNLDPRYENHYLRLLMYKNVNEDEIKGVYAIYFGILYFKNDYAGAWEFLASVLNVEPNSLTAYVLEVYFYILTELLSKTCKKRLEKILRYLQNFYFQKMNNKPIEIRIIQKINEFL